METQKTNYLIPLSIIIAGALIGGGIFLGSQKSMAPVIGNNNQDEVPQELKIKPVSNDDHILGNADAKVMLIEYSDLECPYCKVFHETLHKIMDNYGKDNRVAWVYRHFPLTELHPKAVKEAEASECAAEQGGDDKFFAYIDRLYSITPANDGFDLKKLPEIAQYVGLDVNKFNECLNSGKYEEKVMAQRQEAIDAGGRGTPYTILVTEKGNLPITRGAVSYEELSAAIDQLLADL
jgi:protein-disulfide isomerase